MLPNTPHPAVKAFSTALKNELNNVSDNVQKSSKHGSKRGQSQIVKKAAQSLGWRNRYSQADLYPLELNYNSLNNDGEVGAKMTKIDIKQVQRGEIENTYGTGATVWPASIVLVKYLEHLHQNNALWDESKHNRRFTIADLGSGTGVTSIAAAFYFGINGDSNCHCNRNSLVVCTDGCDLVVELARENVANISRQHEEKNKMMGRLKKDSEYFQLGQSQVKVRKYLWGDGTLSKELMIGNEENIKDRHFDIILVADCVLPKLYPIDPLVKAIDELAGPTTTAYISYEYRYYPEYDPKEYFTRLAEARGLKVETIPNGSQHPVYSVEDIEIWEVRRNR